MKDEWPNVALMKPTPTKMEPQNPMQTNTKACYVHQDKRNSKPQVEGLLYICVTCRYMVYGACATNHDGRMYGLKVTLMNVILC